MRKDIPVYIVLYGFVFIVLNTDQHIRAKTKSKSFKQVYSQLPTDFLSTEGFQPRGSLFNDRSF